MKKRIFLARLPELKAQRIDEIVAEYGIEALPSYSAADLDQTKCVLIWVDEGDDPFTFAQIERLVQARDASALEVLEPRIQAVDAKDGHERPADVRRRFPDGEVHVAEVALVVGTDGAVSVESKRQPNDVAVESREAVGIGRVQGER